MVLESKSVIVKSDNVFFSHRLDNNCSDTSAGKKASGCLKVSRVAELVGASLDNVLPVVVSKANSSVLLLFTVRISGRSKTQAVLKFRRASGRCARERPGGPSSFFACNHLCGDTHRKRQRRRNAHSCRLDVPRISLERYRR